MALKSRADLLTELNAAVRSGGQGGKTTALDVRNFLTSLVDEVLTRFAEQSQGDASALSEDVLNALSGSSGVPSENNRFVTQQDFDPFKASSETILRRSALKDIAFQIAATETRGTITLAPLQYGRFSTLIGENISKVRLNNINSNNSFHDGPAEGYLDNTFDASEGSDIISADIIKMDNTLPATLYVFRDTSAEFTIGQGAIIEEKLSVELQNKLNNKVDKALGKGLSTEDYTTAEKTKLSELSASSVVVVQNTGSSPTAVMSQNAVTEAIKFNVTRSTFGVTDQRFNDLRDAVPAYTVPNEFTYWNVNVFQQYNYLTGQRYHCRINAQYNIIILNYGVGNPTQLNLIGVSIHNAYIQIGSLLIEKINNFNKSLLDNCKLSNIGGGYIEITTGAHLTILDTDCANIPVRGVGTLVLQGRTVVDLNTVASTVTIIDERTVVASSSLYTSSTVSETQLGDVKSDSGLSITNEVPLSSIDGAVCLCVAEGSASSHPSSEFASVALTNVTLDRKPAGTSGGFDPETQEYVAPVSGTYQVTTKLRLTDNAIGPNQSYGQGAGVVNEDGPWFQWFVGTSGALTNRNGSLNQRLLRLNTG
ncbi:MAG TPA: hypothetical protein VF690_14965, partial [Hymenobacter sp.]